MRDDEGNVIELIEGNYHPHIAVNWLEDEDGNWIELVEVKK
jgi:catechol 2,3-dioxygenase-like lactoylglutathione lyase family enzyme